MLFYAINSMTEIQRLILNFDTIRIIKNRLFFKDIAVQIGNISSLHMTEWHFGNKTNYTGKKQRVPAFSHSSGEQRFFEYAKKEDQ